MDHCRIDSLNKQATGCLFPPPFHPTARKNQTKYDDVVSAAGLLSGDFQVHITRTHTLWRNFKISCPAWRWRMCTLFSEAASARIHSCQSCPERSWAPRRFFLTYCFVLSVRAAGAIAFLSGLASMVRNDFTHIYTKSLIGVCQFVKITVHPVHDKKNKYKYKF